MVHVSRAVVQGVRWMFRRPLVSLTSALCLSVGVAACATAWTLIDAAILRPYGLVGASRLSVAWEADLTRNQPLIEVSYLNFLDWQREARTVESMAAFGSQHWPALARIGSEMVPLTTRGISTTFLPTLGARPALGRNFEPRDAQATAPPALILSHRLWQTRFGGQPSIVGQTLFVDGSDHVIVGVMPAGFAYPDDPDAFVSVERVLGEAFQDMPVDQQRNVGVLEVLVQRNASASNDDVRAELTSIVQGLQQQHAPSAAAGAVTASVTPLADMIVGRLGQRLWIALGMSAAVFLLACANVAAARAAQLRERAAELTARLFLGATRTGLIRDLALEPVSLLALSALATALLWVLLVRLLSTSPSIAGSGLALDDYWASTAVTMAGLGALSWVLVAFWPAVVASRHTVRSAEQGSTRVAPRTSRIGAPLLFSQAAMAIAVVALAGAALQTFARLSRIDMGFATRGVTLVDFSLPAWKYTKPGENRTKVEQLRAGLRELSPVTHVAAVSVRPFRFGEIVDGLPVRRTGDAVVQPDDATSASRVAVTPDYFDALGQRIVEGRAFNAFDQPKSEPVVIISHTLARALFGDRAALGERIDTFTLSEKWRSRVIVGIAGDAQYRGLERPSLEVYVPLTQTQTSIGSLVIASAAPLTEATIRRALRRVEPDVAIEGFQTTAELRASVLSPARLLTTVVSLLGGAGLLLLALGIFAAAAGGPRSAWGETAVKQRVGARPLQAAGAPLRLLTRALATGIVAGLALAPAVLSAAASVGLSSPGAFLLPLLGAIAVVPTAAAVAIVPSLVRAAKRPPAELLRDA
jgi:putative ABC transport system permease protein